MADGLYFVINLETASRLRMSANSSGIEPDRFARSKSEFVSGGSENPITGTCRHSNKKVSQVPLKPVCPVTKIGPGSPFNRVPSIKSMVKL